MTQLISALLICGMAHGWTFSHFRTLSSTRLFSSSTESSLTNDLNQVSTPSTFYQSLDQSYESTVSSIATTTSPTTTLPPPRFQVSKHAPRSLPHLFRHYDDISFDSWLRCTGPEDFLASVGYDISQFPADLLEKDVHSDLAPHVRFLVQVLQGGTGRLAWATEEAPEMDEECRIENEEEEHHTMVVSKETKQIVPHLFFHCSVERTLAPYHAYLQHHGLVHGAELLQQPDKLYQFLQVCQSAQPAQFVQLCREWDTTIPHSLSRLQAWSSSFRRGLAPAVRNAHSADLETVDCTPAQMVDLLVSHGANFLQKDAHGVSPLHWAAGTHHGGAVEILVNALVQERYGTDKDPNAVPTVLLEATDSKDGATPLHWAACGLGRHSIGTGGSCTVCAQLLQLAGSGGQELVQATTWYGAAPLHWAAWAGSLDVMCLLLSAGADPLALDRHQQSAVHWAAAAGHVPVCQYLYQVLGSDALEAMDVSGRTAMDYAQDYRRSDLVEWLQSISPDDKTSQSLLQSKLAP